MDSRLQYCALATRVHIPLATRVHIPCSSSILSECHRNASRRSRTSAELGTTAGPPPPGPPPPPPTIMGGGALSGARCGVPGAERSG